MPTTRLFDTLHISRCQSSIGQTEVIVVLEAQNIWLCKTMALKHQPQTVRLNTYNRRAVDGLADVFLNGKQGGRSDSDDKDLRASVGSLATQLSFVTRVRRMGPA